MDRCLAASQARGLAGVQDRQGLAPILRVRVCIQPCRRSNQAQALSVSLVPLIYLNRSDLRVALSANARHQPYPYRAMFAGHSMQSACRECVATTSGIPIAVLIHAIPSRVSTEDTGTAIEG
jgi:hypothetical protein